MLNEIPVLDKGYVALHSCSPSGKDLVLLSREFFRGPVDERLYQTTHVLLKIKCPLFVQLSLHEHGLRALASRNIPEVQAFVPTVAEVNAMSLEASEAIQADIEQTTAALLINPKAYQSENCDLFISQVVSPVSVYNVLIVSGSLAQWLGYIAQKGMPAPIESYRKAVAAALNAEYTFLRK